MSTFAIISNGIVDNVIVAESKNIAEELNPGKTCVEYTEESPAGIGWSYDGTAFTAPEVTE